MGVLIFYGHNDYYRTLWKCINLKCSLRKRVKLMSYSPITVQKIEEYILFSKEAKDQHPDAANLPLTEINPNYKQDVSQTESWRYVHSADYHYFVSRVLFLNHVVEYSFFSAQQCIENYLKAYLRDHNKTPSNTHKLTDLLNKCKSLSSDPLSFINSVYADVIIQKFDPFNEVARYPVQNVRPKDGYGFFYPLDIYMLDYFVFQMRKVLSVPKTTWDIFDEGLQNLQMCMRHCPEFYNRLKENNINFS